MRNVFQIVLGARLWLYVTLLEQGIGLMNQSQHRWREGHLNRMYREKEACLQRPYIGWPGSEEQLLMMTATGKEWEGHAKCTFPWANVEPFISSNWQKWNCAVEIAPVDFRITGLISITAVGLTLLGYLTRRQVGRMVMWGSTTRQLYLLAVRIWTS